MNRFCFFVWVFNFFFPLAIYFPAIILANERNEVRATLDGEASGFHCVKVK